MYYNRLGLKTLGICETYVNTSRDRLKTVAIDGFFGAGLGQYPS
jgi:hypothetical protein